MQFAQAEVDESDDSEDDEDFVPGHVSEGSVDSDSTDDSSSATSEDSVEPTHSNTQNTIGQEASETSSESGSDSSSDSASETDTDAQSNTGVKAEASADSNSDSDFDSDTSETESDSDSDSGSDNEAPDVLSSKPTVPPWSGSKETRRRNFRRKQLVKLKQLKADGKLHPDATYADLQEYLGTSKEPDSKKPTPVHAMSKSTGKRKRLGEEAEEHKLQALADETVELERRRKELMARLADDVPDVEMTPVDSLNSTVEQSEGAASASASPAITSGSISKRSTTTPTPPTKRLRPNVSAIGRILQRQAVVSSILTLI